jgi:PAS domain S-box-containing protein
MDALSRFRGWRKRAVAADGDRVTPIAETVQWVSLVYGGASIVAALAVLLAFPASPAALPVSLACIALNGLALVLVRRNHADAGALVLIASCFGSILIALAARGGVSVTAQSGLVLAICSAGLVLGQRAAFLLAALSSLAGPVFREWLPGTDVSADGGHASWLGLWMLQSAIFFSAAALVSIVVAHAERALGRARRSEARFRAIADNMQDIIVELDGERLTYANPEFQRRLEIHSPEELARVRVADMIHPEDMPFVAREIARVLAGGNPARFSARIQDPRGGISVAEVSAGVIVDARGRRRVVTLSRDVTAQRITEDALRDSEERFRLLAENAPDMITEFDPSGRIVYANRAVTDRGFDTQELRDSPFGEWNHPDDRAACLAAFERTMTFGQSAPLVHRVRNNKDGNYRWVSSSASAFRTSKGEMRLVAQSRDITEELELQEQLRQAQKMEAIGRLAGGVAHDFNNLLTVIGGYADVLASSTGDVHAREAAREIGAAADRAAGLTRQLLALSRRQLAKSRIVDLNEQIRGLEPVLRRTLPERIELELTLDPELPRVEADPSQLDQVLLNLALNARDAMPGRGRLRIETRHSRGQHRLQLLVSDTGLGMSEETRQRAFEPFFTTKPVGEGSGLGLSTTYGIVQQAGGSITLDSAPGCGTRVSIELPGAPDGVIPTVVTASRPPRAVRPGTGVLLVEDDPAVRRLLTVLLEASGYRVIAAASGDEALRLADAGPLAIDLVLSDYVLPGLSGVEVCAELQRRWPDLRFVVMTGHAEVPTVGGAGLPEGAELLGKPFTREQLEDTLARQLATSS